jgi:hypothetical protein
MSILIWRVDIFLVSKGLLISFSCTRALSSSSHWKGCDYSQLFAIAIVRLMDHRLPKPNLGLDKNSIWDQKISNPSICITGMYK